MASTRIVIAGGSGFLGSRICQSAVARGWEVVSLSRHGEPSWETRTPSAQRPRWAEYVNWEKADLLDPESYARYLTDASAVVHSSGIILEADYKSILQGTGSPVTTAQKILGMVAGQPGGAAKGQMSYQTMNVDSAVSLAKSAFNKKVPAFVYISASAGAPIIPEGYITSKRKAESSIVEALPDMRSVFIRAPFMYGSSRSMSMPLALGGMVGSEVNSLVGGKLSFMGSMVQKPLKVSTVGEAVVESIDDKEVKGVVGPRKIEDLATKGWRKTML